VLQVAVARELAPNGMAQARRKTAAGNSRAWGRRKLTAVLQVAVARKLVLNGLA